MQYEKWWIEQNQENKSNVVNSITFLEFMVALFQGKKMIFIKHITKVMRYLISKITIQCDAKSIELITKFHEWHPSDVNK